MAFEPRILRPDESSGSERNSPTSPLAPRNEQQAPDRPAKIALAHETPEELDLPDDLGELAAQLAAEAAFLESRYPAPNRIASEPSAVGWRLLRITAAAMLMTGSVWWVAHRRAAEHRTAELRSSEPLTIERAAIEPRKFDSAMSPTGQPITRQAELAQPALAPPSVREAAEEAKFGHRGAYVAELSLAGESDPPALAPRDRLGMLEAQLSAFEKVIARLQAEVRRRDQLLEESGELIKSLTAEVESLRKAPAGASRPAGANDSPNVAAGSP